MKTTVESLEGFQKKVTVELDASEVDDRINKQYKDFAYRYNFPGFRKGKAPRQVVDNALGQNAVAASVTEDILNAGFPQALDEHNLVTIGQPAFEESDAMVEQGKPFSFYFTVETRPEVELSSYDNVKVKLPSTEATDAEVEEQIEELLNYYYDFEDAAASKKLGTGDFAEISLSVTNEAGEAIESLSAESRLYELNTGLFPAAFDEGLSGMKKGEKKTIEVDMAEPSMMSESLAEHGKCTFEVEVKQVKKRVLPDLTDEWVKNTAGFESVAELRERMAEQIKMQKEQLLPRVRENEALYELQKRVEVDVPEVMLEAQEQELLQNFFSQLQQSGMSFDMFLAQNGMNPDTFKDDIKKQAADIAKQDLALDAWARHAKIDVTPTDVSREFLRSGAEDPEALEAEWKKNGRLPALRSAIARTFAMNEILEKLEVEELAPGEKIVHGEDEKPAKKTAKKAPAKKAAKKDESGADDKKKPAAKKATAKKTASKKAASDKDEAGEKA